jgi:hypothetical protein
LQRTTTIQIPACKVCCTCSMHGALTSWKNAERQNTASWPVRLL